MVLEWLKSNRKIVLTIVAYFVILTIVACVISVVITLSQKQPEKVIDEVLLKLIGDGYCDDATNTNAFDFDGGDCCINPIQIGDCQLCNCYQDGMIYTTTIEATTTTEVESWTNTKLYLSSENTTTSSLTTKLENTGPCPLHFIEAEDFCLLIKEEMQTYSSAMFDCPHGFIFEPENLAMEQQMNAYIPTEIQYWIGMTYLYDQEVLMYTSSALPVNYTNFHPGIQEVCTDPTKGSTKPTKCCVIMAYINETWAWLPEFCGPLSVNTVSNVVCVTNKSEL